MNIYLMSGSTLKRSLDTLLDGFLWFSHAFLTIDKTLSVVNASGGTTSNVTTLALSSGEGFQLKS